MITENVFCPFLGITHSCPGVSDETGGDCKLLTRNWKQIKSKLWKKNPKKQTAEARIKGSQNTEVTEVCLSHIIPCSGLLHYSFYCFLYTVFPDCAIRWLFVDCTYYKWYFSILMFPDLFKGQNVPRPLSVQLWIPPWAVILPLHTLFGKGAALILQTTNGSDMMNLGCEPSL